MSIFESAHGVEVNNANLNSVGRDMSSNRSYDSRQDGHNFSGPSNYRQQSSGKGTSVFAEGNGQVSTNTNIFTLDADISINYMERNPHFLQAIVDVFATIFPFFRRSETYPSNTVPISALIPNSTDPTKNQQFINDDLFLEHVTAESSVPTKVNSDVKYGREAAIMETNIDSFPNYEMGSLPLEARALFKTAPVSSEIYIEKMLPLKNGYPLCFPQPARGLPVEYRSRGVSIGDVGVITRNGGFDFLFNVLLPAQHPINLPACLPNEFDSVLRPILHTASQTSVDPGDSKISSLYVESDIDMNTRDISFSCKDEDAGAILSLPHGASEIDMANEWHWKQFIIKHALNWYKYARNNCGRDLDRHSLYFITGCMKSKTWGIATFDTSVQNRNSVLVIGKSGDVNKPSYIWKRSGGASSWRSGPLPDPDFVAGNEIQDNTDNQCLFLRGFKIALSEETWDELWDLTGVATTNKGGGKSFEREASHERVNGNGSKSNVGNESGAQSSSRPNCGNNMKVTHFPVKNTPLHPLSIINNMLFSNVPDACIAITHDNVWCELIGKSDWDAERLREIIQDQYAVRYYEDTRTCVLEPKSINISADRDQSLDSNLEDLKTLLRIEHDSRMGMTSAPILVYPSVSSLNPMRHEDTTVFQALVDALLQPFTPILYSSLDTPDVWIRVYHDRLQRTIATTGVLPIEELDHIYAQLYPRCTLYVLAYAKTHGHIRAFLDIKEKMRIWGRLEVLTQFIEFQAILESLRASLLNCGQLESQGMRTLDMILRFDILFVTAKVLVWLSDNEHRLTCRSETGDRAQALLDLFQSLLDCHPQGSSRAQLLDATFRLSKESGRVPSCLVLNNLDKDDCNVALGGGGYGDIWGGRIGKNRVAIKSMRNFNERPLEDAIKAFAREAVLWRQFHHPNILPFYGVHLWRREPQPLVCLVSPWMEKGNVLEYLQNPECKDRLSLLLDVARGVEYLHNLRPPVIHGDLKGNNILITPSGGACIADFGLYTFTRDYGYLMTNRNSTGNTGEILHCAPELLSPGSIDSIVTQAAGGTVPEPYKSKESDMYAFGCLCFEIYTGRPRFYQMPIYFAMFAIYKDRSVPQPTNIDHSLWELIQTCWQRRPRVRPLITDIVRTLSLFVNRGGDQNTRECVFKWDQQVICQLNSPWAALVTPFGLRQGKYHPHNNMTSVSVLLSEEDIRIVSRRDIIIALMGPSGVGKSSFINAVLGHDVAIVGRSMGSCTQDVRAYGCLHPDGSGRKVIMVDTPGFDDSERTDYEVLKDIVNWLADTYRQDIVLTGILQLHSIAEVRMLGTPRKNLDVFRRLCGEDGLKNVILTTTYWDKVPSNIAEMRESELKSVFWGHMIEHGCRINRFYPPTTKTAWSLVSSFDNNARQLALTVQTEMTIQKKKLRQTSAFGALPEWWGKKLRSLHSRFKKNKHPSEKELARAEKEMRKMTRNNSRSSSIRKV
ncbi:hypothetical protein BDQ17DRAFT_1305004 [Cyathus striatus]|nr:hypothetical protein BDQ17DRAFT_1305004 [Cyathus striatus]